MKKNLSEMAYDKIRELLFKGDFKPGDALSEDMLAKKLSISRTPIREAIKNLETDGYLKKYKNRGIIVNELTPQTMQEIFEIRTIFEEYAVNKIFDNHIKVDINELKENVKITKEYLDKKDYLKYLENERKFHMMLIEYADNEQMVGVMTRYNNIQSMALLYKMTHKRNYDSQPTIKEHQTIVKAFETGDKDLVLTAVKKHTENVRNRIM